MNTEITQLKCTMKRRLPKQTQSSDDRATQPTPVITFSMNVNETTHELRDLRERIKYLEAKLADRMVEITNAQSIEQSAIAHTLSIASIANAAVIEMQCAQSMPKINKDMDELLEQLHKPAVDDCWQANANAHIKSLGLDLQLQLSESKQIAKDVVMCYFGFRDKVKMHLSIEQLAGDESMNFKQFYRQAAIVSHTDKTKGALDGLFMLLAPVKELHETVVADQKCTQNRKLLNKIKRALGICVGQPKPKPPTKPSTDLWLAESRIKWTFSPTNAFAKALTKKEQRSDSHCNELKQMKQHIAVGGFQKHLPYTGQLMRIVKSNRCYYFAVTVKGNHRYVHLNCNEKIDFTPKKHMQLLLDMCVC